jgi:hypothetical protein
MGFWWFGRKSAPPDMRPFVPAWLSTAEAEEGFARSFDCMGSSKVRKAKLHKQLDFRRPEIAAFWQQFRRIPHLAPQPALS